MPAHLHHNPLRVEFVFPDDTRYKAPFDTTANPVLAEELAAGLAAMVHPHGTIGTRGTAEAYATGLRGTVRWMTDDGFTGGLAQITRPLLLRYWLASSVERGDYSRALMRAAHQAGVTMAPDVVQYLHGRPLKARRKKEPLKPYTEGEWKRITAALQDVVSQAWAEHRSALAAAAEAGEGLHTGRITRAYIARELLDHGPMSNLTFQAHAECGRNEVLTSDLTPMREALYPSAETITAYRLLLGVYTGVVPDGINSLGLGDVTWSGDSSVLLDYIKGRTGPESVNLTGRPVRLIEQWLNHSKVLRRHAPPAIREDLWIRLRRRTGGNTPGTGYMITGIGGGGIIRTGGAQRRLVQQTGLLDDQGNPLRIHASRLRTTYLNTLSRKGWTGNTAIDPNHTTAVEGDRYLTAQTPAQMDAVETIIEESQANILRRALPPVVLTQEAAAKAAADLPATAAELGVTDGALAELLGGERDVFTASCKDPLSGLHGPTGKPCPARPWVCLLCPLAVFMPRHAANLLRLRSYFERQSRQMTSAQFIAVFGPYADRLDQEIIPAFPEAVLEQAAAAVMDTDAEIPVRPEEMTL